MKLLLLAVLPLISMLYVIPVSATVSCSSHRYSRPWTCTYRCCFNYFNCCTSFGSVYWYAWFIIIIIVLLCICCCAGAGGYGYRRYYYVRRVECSPPTCTLVTNTTTVTSNPGVQLQFPNTNQYQPYVEPTKTSKAPPPYSPNGGYQPVPSKY